MKKQNRRRVALVAALLACLLGLALHYHFIGRNIGRIERTTPHRMRPVEIIETNDEYFIMVDAETGCCYLFSKYGGVCQLSNYDGSPYLANGWRDIG